MDPRVKAPVRALAAMYATSRALDSAIAHAADAMTQVRAVRAVARASRDKGAGSIVEALAALDATLGTIEGGGGGRFGGGATPESLGQVRSDLEQLFGQVEDADAAPTTQLAAAVAERRAALAMLLDRWATLRRTEIPKLNAQLSAAGLAELPR